MPSFGLDGLYFVSAASGGGSVELPFDRGIMETAVIRFERVGGRVAVNQVNTRYRALSGDAAQAAGVADSFPTSVLATLPVEAEAGGRVLVDATALFLRDAADVEGDLKRANQGSYKFDPARSSFNPARTRAFPQNTEVETTLTFVADAPGPLVNNVAPDAQVLTLRIRHSFLKAPTGYVPRAADPRTGVSPICYTHLYRRFC